MKLSTKGRYGLRAMIDIGMFSTEDSDSCATKFVWKKISDSINEVVNNITLKDLVDEQFEIDHLTQEEHIG
jgi:DNA-binding IscR family transcriptional regulator